MPYLAHEIQLIAAVRPSRRCGRWTALVAGAVFCAASIAGCATYPDMERIAPPVRWLPEGESVYLKLSLDAVDAATLAAVTELLQKQIPEAAGGTVEQAFERTHEIYLAVEGGDPGSRVSLVAIGDYPRGSIGLAMLFSPDWRRIPGPVPWYENAGSGLSLTFPSRSLLIVATGDLTGMLRRFDEPGPSEFELMLSQQDSPLVAFLYSGEGGLPLSDGLLSGGLASLPIDRLSLAAREIGDEYELDISLELRPKSAVAIYAPVAKFILAQAKRNRGAANLSEASVGIDDGWLVVRGIRLTREELIDALASTIYEQEGEVS